MRLPKALATIVLTGFLAGCATDYAWLESPLDVFCVSTDLSDCAAAYADHLVQQLAETDEPGEIPESVQDLILAYATFPGTELHRSKHGHPILDAYIDAGVKVGAYARSPTSENLSILDEIESTETRMKAFVQLWLALGDRLPRDHAAHMLSELLLHDPEGYYMVQASRLPVMIALGDLERARALRDELLEEGVQLSPHLSIVALVSSSYAVAGLDTDALTILRGASEKGTAITEDDLQLIKLMAQAGKGDYPSPQDFLFFTDDSTRFEAYIAMAQLTHSVGTGSQSKRLIQEAVTFIQKTSYAGDEEKSLARILQLLAKITHRA